MDANQKILVEKRNSEFHLRPRFTIELSKDDDIIIESFKSVFLSNKYNYLGKIVDGHIFISVAKKDEHFWSPQLHLEIVSQENTTLLKGLFGPKPQVWTMFMFVHFVIGISFIGMIVLLYTKISLDENFIYPLVLVIFLPLIWVILYLLGNIGKDRGKKQMKELHDFMIEVIEENQLL